MIQLENFSLSFKEKKVLNSINLSIREKEQFAVIGNNASGKTSLALFLAGVIPEFINAKISGNYKMPKNTSLIMQNPSNQFFALTVKEELSAKGIALAKKLGAVHLLEKNVFELSEGEKQKINLISNLALEPEVLLLDEPLELLDPFEAKRFNEIIQKLCNETIIWLDKEKNFPVKMKKFFLSTQEKKSFPKKKDNAQEKIVLETYFSLKKNSFELKKINFELRAGEKIGVIGANGSGKTTLLKTIAGLNNFSGKLELKKNASFAPQNPSHLFFNETVEAELLDKGNAHLLGISSLLKQAPDKLSKGQQKLVSIAATEQGSIVLLDEPTTWLDLQNKAVVYDFINNSTDAMVIATHDKKLLDYCDRVFLLEKGVIKECSSTIINRFFLALQN